MISLVSYSGSSSEEEETNESAATDERRKRRVDDHITASRSKWSKTDTRMVMHSHNSNLTSVSVAGADNCHNSNLTSVSVAGADNINRHNSNLTSVSVAGADNSHNSNLTSVSSVSVPGAGGDNCKRLKPRLPLPGAIQEMFQGKVSQEQSRDDPTLHSGRVRSFPHVEGNWASYVYVPVSPDQRLSAFVEQLLVCLRPLNFERMEDLHLSISRTVCIRHHWIQPLTQSLKEKFGEIDSCLCDITSVKMYTNDDKTRTFVSLQVEGDGTLLQDFVSAVDSAFSEFKLPPFYKNPSFHISLVWSVGDMTSQISDKTTQQIQSMTRTFLSSNTDLSVLPINEVCLRTGNKMFSFHLASP